MFQAMLRCSQPVPCSAFNNDGSIYAYAVCPLSNSLQVCYIVK
jgi:hypothetical protein